LHDKQYINMKQSQFIIFQDVEDTNFFNNTTDSTSQVVKVECIIKVLGVKHKI
jgi:hypothetical protein